MTEERSSRDESRSGRRRSRRSARRRRRLPLRWIAFGSVLAILSLAYFLPTIVANSPLNRWVLDPIEEQLNGEVRYQAASLGWFSPVVISGVTVADPDKNLVASIAQLSTSTSLIDLLNDPLSPGPITLRQPSVKAVLRRDGSNIEDLIQPLLQDSSDSAAAAHVKIIVIDGAIELADAQGEQVGEIRSIEGELDCRTSEKAVEWKVTAEMAVDQNSGPVSCKGQANFGDVREGDLAWQSTTAPMGGLQVALARFDPNIQCDGALTSNGELRWDAQGCLATLNDFQVRDLEFAGAAALQGDRLRTKQFTAIGNVYIGSQDIRCRGLALRADWAELNLSCDLELGAMGRAVSEQSWNDLVSAARGEAHGWIDLALLSQTLPRAARVREDTVIKEGGATFRIANVEASSSPNGGQASAKHARRIDLQLNMRPVVAVSSGRTVQWRDPIQLVASATHDQAGWTIDQLTCFSDFLTIKGAGPPAKGELTVQGDLGQLRNRLEQFVDLRGVEFSGDVQGRGSWNRTAERVNIGGELAISRFSLQLDAGRRWDEPRVSLSATASLRRDISDRWGLENWHGELAIDKDSVGVEPQAEGYLVHLNGDVRRWSRIAETTGLAPPLEFSVEGRVDAQAHVIASPDAFEVRSSSLEIQDLKLQTATGSVVVREPNVAASISGRLQLEPSQWTTREASLRSSTLSAATTHLNIAVSPSTKIDAAISVRGDLGRVSKLLGAAIAPYDFAGTVVGQCDLATTGTAVSLQWDISTERFSASKTPTQSQPQVTPVSRRRAELVWQEPNLRATGRVAVDLDTGAIEIERMECNTDWLAVATQGNLLFNDHESLVDVKGALTYDWPTAMDRLSLTQDGQIKVFGRQSQTFAIRGPVSKRTERQALAAKQPRPEEALVPKGPAIAPLGLTATSAIGWDRAEAFGFTIGAVTLRSQLRDSVAVFEPVHVDLNQGQATLNPRIDLSQSPGVISLKKGDGIRKIDLTPEMCRGWLKYVAPLLADSTRAQGNMSLELERASAPIDDLNSLQSQGVLIVHQAQVGPGSLTTKLLGPLQQILSVVDPQSAADLARPTWIAIPTQQVEFQVQQGRVYHKQLMLRLRDVEIRTTGSVGFDQTLDLVAEIPVLDRWIKKSRYLESLRGKSIPLRVRGTFAKPNVDESVLRRLAQDSARGATEQLLKEQIERGLKKLFK